MVDINWTVAVLIVNFLFLIFILNIVCYKPIRGILLQRKAKFEGLENGITSAQQEAEGKDQAFADGVKQARAKGQREKERLVQAAADEEKNIIEEINTKAKADLEAMKAKITSDTEAVKAALEKDVSTFADAITQKILGRAA
jgi:F-type H+-transporting ATPase subunit b